MVSEQFSQAVRGDSGEPISVGSTGSLETNEYGQGTAVTDSSYPISINPAFTIEEVLAFALPADKVVNLTLSNGNTINGIETDGPGWTLNTLEIDSLEVTDPEASGGDTSLVVIGD